jgi:hypothetical protein
MDLSESTATMIAAILGLASTFATFFGTRYYNFKDRKREREKLQENYNEGIKKLEGEIDQKVDLEVEKRIEVFDAPSDGSYNKKFYDYFETKIRSAKECIYITGDGFDFKTQEGSRIAEKFNMAIREALGKNIEVIRVQIKPNSSEKWAKLISELIKDFPENFKFYFLQKGKKAQISSICVIDPDDEENNVSEIMLSTTKVRGVNRDAVAGTGIFIEGKKQLANSFRDGVLSLIEDSMRLKTSKEVRKYLIGNGQNAQEDQTA